MPRYFNNNIQDDLLFLPLADPARRQPVLVSATTLNNNNNNNNTTTIITTTIITQQQYNELRYLIKSQYTVHQTETHMMPEPFPNAVAGDSATNSSTTATPLFPT